MRRTGYFDGYRGAEDHAAGVMTPRSMRHGTHALGINNVACREAGSSSFIRIHRRSELSGTSVPMTLPLYYPIPRKDNSDHPSTLCMPSAQTNEQHARYPKLDAPGCRSYGARSVLVQRTHEELLQRPAEEGGVVEVGVVVVDGAALAATRGADVRAVDLCRVERQQSWPTAHG